MNLNWNSPEEIAWALLDKYPDQDPLGLSFPKLRQMVVDLPDFADDPDSSNEHILERIQMTWLDEKK
jgi:FeS assembly protein IscX